MKFCSTLTLGFFLVFTQGLVAQSQITLPISPLLVSSGFGNRIHPISKKSDYHKGVDLPIQAGLVRCILDGKVRSCGYDARLGNYVSISHGEIESIYGHLSRIVVSREDRVFSGQIIAISGRSGSATGEHLHFAISFKGIAIHPLRFMAGLMERQAGQNPNGYE